MRWSHTQKTILTLGVVALLISSGLVAFHYVGARNIPAAATTSVTSISGVTSSSSTPSVDTAFVTHLLNLASQNLNQTISDYDSNATIVWKGGSIYGGEGNFTTIHQFPELFGNVLVPTELPFLVKNLTYATSTNGDSAFINATFALAGPYGCKFLALVNAQEEYSLINGRWLITDEVWNIHNVYGVTCLQVST